MTLGLIIGIIFFIIYFLGGILDEKGRIVTDKIISSLVIAVIIFVISWGIISGLSCVIIDGIFHINKTKIYQESTYEVSAAKIESNKNNSSPYLIYTDSNGETNQISTNKIKFIEDYENNFITIYENRSKLRFFSHLLDSTSYEYYGNIKELYK